MIIHERIKELVSQNLTENNKDIIGYLESKNDISNMTNFVYLLLFRKQYFNEYPAIVYNGFINEDDSNIFETIIDKLKDMTKKTDLHNLSLNELYTLSSLHEYLIGEENIKSFKNDFTIHRNNEKANTEHYVHTFDYICEAINFKKFGTKLKDSSDSLLGFHFEDFHFDLSKEHLLLELKDLLNYKIQNTNFYKNNIDTVNKIIKKIEIEYPDINNNIKKYDLSISDDYKRHHSFHAITRSLKSGIDNWYVANDEIRKFMHLGKVFEISNNIEYMTLEYYDFKGKAFLLGKSKSQRTWSKDIAISQFKEAFKDKIVATSSKSLAETEGFYFVSLSEPNSYENFEFLMYNDFNKAYMDKDNASLIFETFNNIIDTHKDINKFDLYEKFHEKLKETMTSLKNTSKNKLKL